MPCEGLHVGNGVEVVSDLVDLNLILHKTSLLSAPFRTPLGNQDTLAS